MVCTWTCALAVGLIIASLLPNMASTDKQDKLETLLTPEQKDVYDQIIEERTKLYMQGLAIGLILAFLYLRYYKMEIMSSICIFVCITVLAQVTYYLLMPKSKWMLNYLDNSAQNDAWLELYKDKMNRWHWGFIIGIIGYGVLCYALIKN